MNQEQSLSDRLRPLLVAVSLFFVFRFVRRRLGGGTARPPKKARRTVMIGPDLTGADLSSTNWEKAVIMRGILKDADLSGANLREAKLRRLDMRGANLSGADLTGAELKRVAFDKTTTLPDGSKWNRRAKMKRFTNANANDYFQVPTEEDSPVFVE